MSFYCSCATFQPSALQLRPALFNAARRCQGLNPSCNQTSNSSNATAHAGRPLVNQTTAAPSSTNATSSSTAHRLFRFVGSSDHAPAAGARTQADRTPPVKTPQAAPALVAANKAHEMSISGRQVLAEPPGLPLPSNSSSNDSQATLNMPRPLHPVVVAPMTHLFSSLTIRAQSGARHPEKRFIKQQRQQLHPPLPVSTEGP